MKNYSKLEILEIYKIINNSLITAKLPCHTSNLNTIPKYEKLIFWPVDDYSFTLSPPTLKWNLHFLLRKKTNKREKKPPKQKQKQTKNMTATQTWKQTSTNRPTTRTTKTNKKTKEK